jgi:hypothetical protein
MGCWSVAAPRSLAEDRSELRPELFPGVGKSVAGEFMTIRLVATWAFGGECARGASWAWCPATRLVLTAATPGPRAGSYTLGCT